MKLKKLISMILCVCMLVSLMPTVAFADEEEPAVPETPVCEHDYVATQVVEPTCTTQGYTVYVCSLCGDTINGDYTPTADHTPEEAAAIPATCVKEGRTAGHVCSVCGAVLDGCEPVGKAAHTPVAAEAIVPSCIAEGRTAGTVCEVCGEVIDGCESFAKTDHTPVDVDEVPPACTEPGRKAGTVCSVCKEVLDGCEPIEATGHTPVEVAEVPPEIGKPGTTAGHVCEVCGEILDGCEPIDALEEETEITIEKQPEDAEPVEGEVIFNVIASVNTETEISYQWQKLDESITYSTDAEREAAWKNIEGETSAKLRLTGLDDADALAEAMKYAYRCVVAAGAMKTSSEVHIIKTSILKAPMRSSSSNVSSGTCGDNLTWELDDNGILTIIGFGEMTEYSVSLSAPWSIESENIKEIVLPNNLTSIGAYAFTCCSSVTSVTIPNNVNSIGKYAFYHCSNLKSINIPNKVENINESTFSFCTALSSILIPNGVKNIGKYAFYNCSSLTYITIPASVVSINDKAFYGCSSIATVNICDIAAWCNIDFGLNELYWNQEDDHTCNPTYYSKNLSLNNEIVTDLVIPEGITTINGYAFAECSSIVKVYFPESITSIKKGAFYNCNSLSDIYYSGTSEEWYSIDLCNYLTDEIKNADHHYSLLGRGSCGVNQNWVLNSNGILTITGNGAMYDYEFGGYSDRLSTAPWVNYSNRINKIVFDCEMTSIGNYAFAGCSEIATVSIPSGVTRIGEYSFSFCYALSSVIMPLSVTEIGNNAFCRSSSLKEIYYSGTSNQWIAITIGTDNADLSRAEIHFTEASGTCGADGDNLHWTLDEDGVLTISGTGAMADYSSSTHSPWYDYRSQIVSVVIEDGVTNIGDFAFQWCSSLSGITIPEGVTGIGTFAFSQCSSLASISIPASVTGIGSSAFGACNSLSSITVASENTVYCSYESALYTKDMQCLVLFPRTFSGAFAIPAGVTSIGQDAFYGCSGLTEVTIPMGVTSIADYAFSFCTSLTSITIPKSVTSIGENVFHNSSALADVWYVGTQEQWETITGGNDILPSGATLHCFAASGTCGAQGDNLAWLLDNDGTLTISGTGAMADFTQDTRPWNDHLDSIITVVLGSGATSIGDDAFWGLQNMTSAVLPDTLVSIGEYAFEGCLLLSDVTIPLSVTTIEKGAFEACLTLKSIVVPNGVSRIEDDTFNCCNALTSVTIPGSVTSIGLGAFNNCFELTSINIPSCVTSIGDSAFCNCISLTDITIPNGVTYIGNFAFGIVDEGSEWGGVTKLTIPASTTEIGIGAFCGRSFGSAGPLGSGCNYEFGWTSEIPAYAFNGCKLESITIPFGVTSIGEHAFYYCGSLNAITIPNSISNIGDHAFLECDNFEYVLFEGSEEQWEAVTIGEENDPLLNAAVLFVDPDGSIIASGSCGAEGDNLTWTLDSKGTLIITGTGAMQDYHDYNEPWGSYYRFISTVIIEEGVTSIGARVFIDYPTLVSITIPESVASIGEGAFNANRSLTSIAIPAGVTSIGRWAFIYCQNLKTISVASENTEYCCYGGALYTKNMQKLVLCPGGYIGAFDIPSGVTNIGDDAFSWCHSLTSVSIPSSVTSIGEWAFDDCTSLSDVYYAGMENEWNFISIVTDGNDCLLNAVIHFSSCVISFNANGGKNAPAFQVKETGIPVTLSTQIPERLGYTFLGWATTADATAAEYLPGDAYTADSSVTLYAVWQANTYTLKFNRNGSTGSAADIQITADSAEIALPKGFSRTYYTFAGWNTVADGSGASFTDTADAADLIACADEQNVITLYARWELVHYSIRFDSNGGEGEMAPLPMQYSYQAVLRTNTYTRTGYTFTGWNTKADGKGTKYADGATVNNLAKAEGAIVTLYAQWKANTYTLVFDGNGATSGSMKAQAMTYGTAKALTANAFKRTSCTFLGWSFEPIDLDAEDKIPAFADKQKVLNLSPVDGDTVTLYAVWAKNSYRIVFNANSGTGDMSEESAWCEYDGSYRLPACKFTRPGFTFLGWAKSKTGKVVYAEGATVTGLSNVNGKVINLYAVWSVHKYSIVFEGNGAQSGSMKPMSNKSCGSTVTLTANAFKRNGYTFLGWSTDPHAEEPMYPNKAKQTNFCTGDRDVLTLYAIWTPTVYKITYKNAAVSDGNYDGNPPTYTIESGIIALQPLTRPGCVFEGWYLDAKFKTPVTEIPAGSTGAKTFYAKWGGEAFTYTIVFEPNGGNGTMKPLVMACGTPKALTANAFKLTGYAFAGWNTELDGSGTAYANKQSVLNLTEINNGTVWLYAQWTPLDYKITYKNVTATENPNPAAYNVGTGLVLQNVSRPGCTFEGWYLDSKYNTRVTEIEEGHTGNVTLYAKWTVNEKVTYTIAFDGNGATSGKMSALNKRAVGKDYTLTANKFKRTGYTFLGWSPDPDATEPMYLNKAKIGDGNLEVANGETVTLYAVWSPIEYTITYRNVINGNVPAKSTYTIEEAYMLPGPGEEGLIKEGYIFLGWYTTSTFKEGTRVFTIGPGETGNKTLYAKWQQIPS